ncbi:hypothetical protein K438DRAFT_1961924 [Mycena galopus ATCC 62051]|nr:hypothetical protein K438DRAFT_1961924 [Mycena galopus ATCC 62051]
MSLFASIDASEDRYSQSFVSRSQESARSQGLGTDSSFDENRAPNSEGNLYMTMGSQGYTPRPLSNDRQILGPSSSFSTMPMAPGPGFGHGHRQSQSLGDYGIFNSQNEFAPSPSTSLGRRRRTDSLADWSPPSKVRLRAYAIGAAGECDVPEDSREQLVNASMLPMQQLMIVTLATVLGRQGDGSSSTKLQTYLVSAEFKDNVTIPIRCILLDPKLQSYKIGFLDRLMRHIRLNPAVYHIPQEFRAMITTTLFNSAVSKVATSARSDIKRKMAVGWKAGTSIYDLVKSLAYKASQEMTDAIWGRFAWVQMKLVDYKGSGGKDDGAWDWVDNELVKQREKALAIPLAERAAFASFAFEEALKSHLEICKPKSGKKKSSTRIPQWQLDISRAVAEMESYTVEELAGEEDAEPGDDEDGVEGGLSNDPSSLNTNSDVPS